MQIAMCFKVLIIQFLLQIFINFAAASLLFHNVKKMEN